MDIEWLFDDLNGCFMDFGKIWMDFEWLLMVLRKILIDIEWLFKDFERVMMDCGSVMMDFGEI